MKKAVLFTLFILFVMTSYGQDLIIKKTGDELKAKVLEVGVTEIKYKRQDFQDGPTYSILKDEVLLIKYENGINEVITTGSSNDNPKTGTTTPTLESKVAALPPKEKESEKIDYVLGNFNQNGRYISKSRVLTTLKNTKDTEILKLLKKSNSTRVKGNIIAAALGIPLMIGGSLTTVVGLGMMLEDVNPDAKGVAVVGGVLAATGIATQFLNIGFQARSRKRLMTAVDIYNTKYADQTKSE